ncbi:MAG: diphthine synthase [Methanosarcinales archaeon]
MLTFIGLGLYDEKDITLKGLEAIKNADIVFAEFYTSKLMGTTLEKMEKLYDKKIKVLSREDVEQDPVWLKEAIEKKVVFLTGGDALVATTHIDLKLRAMDMGIKTKIIPGTSIISAVCGLTGLQNYKFGKSTSIPFPYKNIISETPYDTIILNKKNNLHTLLFLELDMTINYAIELLLQVEEMQKYNKDNNLMELKDGLAVGIARAGSDNPIVKADYLSKLKDYDFGDPLHILIIPASLHFIEAEALVKLAGAPKEFMVRSI